MKTQHEIKKTNGAGAAHNHWLRGFGSRPPLMAKHDDGAGGGGSGGSGKPPPGGDDGGDDFDEKFNTAFHKAMKGYNERFETKFAKMIETSMGTFQTSITEQLGKLSAPKPDDKGGDGKKLELPPEVAQQLKDAKAIAEKAQKTADEERSKREAAENRARRQEEVQLLTNELAGAKVKDKLLGMTVNHLHGRLARDEETGDVRWKNEDGTLVSVKRGIADYLKSDEGKELLPPRPAGGSGQRPLGATGAGAGDGQPVMSDSDFVSALFPTR